MKRTLTYLLIALTATAALALRPASARADSIVSDEYAIRFYTGESGFSVFIDKENGLYASGSNGSGQLGRGFAGTETKIEPKRVMENVRTADTGKTGFTLAVTLAGEVYAWGSNKFGQLGQGTEYNADNESNFLSAPTPVDIPGNPAVKDVVAGAAHSMILTEGGEVFVFGSNLVGQLGLGLEPGNKVVRGLPVKIDQSAFGGKKVTALASAEYTSYALTEDGDLYAWGENDYGLLGSNNADYRYYALTPEKTALSGVRQISAQSTTAMALLESGKVYVFGNNSFSQFGVPGFTETQSAAPIEIPAFYDEAGEPVSVTVKEILSGGIVNFVLSEDGDVYAFGSGGNGQAGFDVLSSGFIGHPYIAQNNVTAPLKVQFYEALSIYDMTQSGASEGKLPVDTTKPIDVKIASLVGSVGNRTFVSDEAGNMWSWGDNTAGLAASGDVNNCVVPVRATLYRNADYDKEVKQKNYLIKPAVVLCVIFGLGLTWIVYTEIKNARMRKKFKCENL